MYKLLVVDDEAKIREVIREYAEFNGYDVTEAADGMSAVGLCKMNHYDLVILDIMMPKLDGFSCCKEIKKIQDIPIIMLSARNEEYDKLFGFELGIDDYVVKPFSPGIIETDGFVRVLRNPLLKLFHVKRVKALRNLIRCSPFNRSDLHQM